MFVMPSPFHHNHRPRPVKSLYTSFTESISSFFFTQNGLTVNVFLSQQMYSNLLDSHVSSHNPFHVSHRKIVIFSHHFRRSLVVKCFCVAFISMGP